MAALCFLGPFLSYSVLLEDDCKVVRKSYAGVTNPEAVRMLHRTLQQQLEIVRVRERRGVDRVRREEGTGWLLVLVWVVKGMQEVRQF